MVAITFLGLLAVAASAQESGARSTRAILADIAPSLHLAQRRQTCGDMRTCREAVILWCEGYGRADADDDGIPCETVCGSVEEVDEIRAEIGC